MAMPTEELWRDYLAHARWFQGKGLPLHSIDITPLAWCAADGSGETDVWVRSELAEVHVGDSRETYHLLVGYLPAGEGEPDAVVGQLAMPGRGVVDVVDAPRSPKAMKSYLRSITRPQAPGVSWLETPCDPDSPTEVFAGEQSNTTVRIGHDVLFKIFRKLTPGRSLESENLAALASSGITPRLLGMVSTPDSTWDLGVFIERIRLAQDGWAFAVSACQNGRLVIDEMRALGKTLKHLHESFAEVFGISTIDSTIVSSQMLVRLDEAISQVDELTDLRAPLRSVLNLPPSPIDIQRVHGDFHLGQALISPSGWTIIDFEGEPLKTSEERQAPDAVWRDVAGLLRSLDYARSTHPDSGSDQAEQWYVTARTAFLEGYLGACPLPKVLLTAYEIDKAIYELVYEVRNRPTWAGIPRHAIAEALKEKS